MAGTGSRRAISAARRREYTDILKRRRQFYAVNTGLGFVALAGRGRARGRAILGRDRPRRTTACRPARAGRPRSSPSDASDRRDRGHRRACWRSIRGTRRCEARLELVRLRLAQSLDRDRTAGTPAAGHVERRAPAFERALAHRPRGPIILHELSAHGTGTRVDSSTRRGPRVIKSTQLDPRDGVAHRAAHRASSKPWADSPMRQRPRPAQSRSSPAKSGALRLPTLRAPQDRRAPRPSSAPSTTRRDRHPRPDGRPTSASGSRADCARAEHGSAPSPPTSAGTGPRPRFVPVTQAEIVGVFPNHTFRPAPSTSRVRPRPGGGASSCS